VVLPDNNVEQDRVTAPAGRRGLREAAELFAGN
jgi:hypothetical protein